MRHHETPVTMAKIKKTGQSKCWWGYEVELSHTAHGNANGTTTLEHSLAISLQVKHITPMV